MSREAKRRIITAGVWILVALLAVMVSPEAVQFVKQPPQWVRVVNVAGSVSTLAALGVWVNDRIHTMSYGRRVLLTGLCLFPVATVIGSVISYRLGTPPTSSALVVTAACAVTLIGLWLARNDAT